ncbi:uncharacterized protein HMPREF1541_00885 [Cyphellophora europaea CBS 101466]|uniref:Major facilitator superfamily (MFS) profile domain-containing protein n=1 Tax=Cyphellophora europaea (strain CBS 101466) TaxID=1220924 RepID=W2SF82_CYPE1|nr:uncharacterized protein HMPREF1541_00885 [Cyphellophora europaea CBS 101466]ETN46698.1 hypothetical protein HMPREF1541_00885 [Cyphellophora europaea CBS 101466]
MPVTKAHPSLVQNRYVVLGAACMVLFIGIGTVNTFGIFEEHYTNHTLRNEPPERIIVIGSTAASLYMILGVFAGRAADLIGYRPCVFIGSVLMAGANFAASISTTYAQLLASQGVMFGLGLAFAYLPAVSISRALFPGSHGVANGVVVSGGAVGGTALPYVVRTLIASRGLGESFRILGYISVAALAPACLLLRPPTPTVPIWKRQAVNGRRPPIFDLSLFRDARFTSLLTACAVAMFGFLPRYFLLPSSAIARGISPTFTAWLLGLMNGLSIIGRVGVGWYADRYGKVSALNLSFILCGAGHLAFWLPGVMVPHAQGQTTITALFTSFVVYSGIFGSGFIALFPVVVAHLFGAENLASKQGLLNTVVGVGVLAGPSAAYAVVGVGEGRRWELGIVMAGSFMLCGGLLLWVLLSRPLKLAERTRRTSV